MVPAARILQSFLVDALRLAAQGRECVSQLTEQVLDNRVSPAQVRSFYQIVHTLKGTAIMIEGCEEVVEALEGIEARLACQPVTESARRPDWIGQARDAMIVVQDRLNRLQARERFQAPEPEPLVQGMTVRSTIEGQSRLLWFPLSCLTRVLNPEEIGTSRGAIRFEGKWVPTIGEGKSGLAIRVAAGQAVLLFEEALGVSSWSSASVQGAQPGLDIFETAPRAA